MSPGAESAGLSRIALLDFHRNGLLVVRKGCPTLYSDYTTPKPCGRCRELLYHEWSDCASVSMGCPKRGHKGISGFFADLRTWWVEGKESKAKERR